MPDITYKSIFRVFLSIGVVIMLTRIMDVLIIVFSSVILASAIKPVVSKLVKFKIPKTMAILTVVLGFLSFMVIALYLGVQPIVKETSDFIVNFGSFLDSISRNYNIQIPNRDDIVNLVKQYSGNLGNQVGNASGQLVNVGRSVLTALLSTLALIALTFYQLAEENKLRDFVSGLFGQKSDQVKTIIDQTEIKLGSWFRGQLSLMLFIGVITYTGLSVIGFTNSSIASFVLPLAVIAGILEIIPVVGPTIALIPAVFVGAAVSPIYALIIFILYLLIQQVEANIVIPRVMNKAVGLDPVIVIIGIMVGNSLMGPIGSLFSVPVMAVLSVLYEEFKKNNSKQAKKQLAE
jgi:predicted PurR-regulated permease PerM